MVWGSICGKGKLPLIRISGTLRQDEYREILRTNLKLAHTTLYRRRKGIFMQDNAPCHKSRMMKNYFETKKFTRKFKLLRWPACSPDLNPIENCWAILKQKVCKRFPKNLNDLWVVVQEEWAKISDKTIRSVIFSMPRRIRAVIRARGGYTKY